MFINMESDWFIVCLLLLLLGKSESLLAFEMTHLVLVTESKTLCKTCYCGMTFNHKDT